MSTRQLFYAILSLSLLLSFCSLEKVESVSTEINTSNVQAQDETELKEIRELRHRIRRDRYDQILPQLMREYGIDMWIHVNREGINHSHGHWVCSGFYAEPGSNSGVFIFTDRGGKRIERAVLGRRWKGDETDEVEECGAYDIIVDAVDRTEQPGGPDTELDYRYKGIGKFVAERNPKRIGLNFLEKLGPTTCSPTNDGISYTDYLLLTKELGDKYARRLVSSEHLMYEFIARSVKSELEMYRKVRKWIDEGVERKFAEIVPGVTKRRRGVIQRGDLVTVGGGTEGEYDLRGEEPGWKFGNFFELMVRYGYVLREGETELPPELKRLWSEQVKIRKVLEDNIKVGRTGRETFEIIKRKLDELGIIVNVNQQFYKHLDPKKTQVSIDLHGMGKGSYTPRIGSIGPDWQHDMKIPLYHTFVIEFFMYIPMPEWGEGRYLALPHPHDGAYVTERGLEYFSPPPKKIHIIK